MAPSRSSPAEPGDSARLYRLTCAPTWSELAVIDIEEQAVDQLREGLGESGLVKHGDARDPEQLASLFSAVDEEWGRLDTLVNGVGGTFRARFEDTNPKGWDPLIRTNFLHVLHALSFAIPRIRAGAKGGSIINLTTIECHRGAPGFAVYSAAKAAVEQLASTMAVELAPAGIRVNNVAPDYTPTAHTGADNVARRAAVNADGRAHRDFRGPARKTHRRVRLRRVPRF